MGNKVKFNLKNVHAAKLTEKEEGGSTKFEYGVPKAIPGAVSTVSYTHLQMERHRVVFWNIRAF